jgi:hypothetical protein
MEGVVIIAGVEIPGGHGYRQATTDSPVTTDHQ